MTVRFRLRWRVEHGRTLRDLDGVVPLSLCEGIDECELKAVEAESWAGGQGFVLKSGIFGSPEEAAAAGGRALRALLLTSLRRGYGITINTRVPVGMFTEYGKQMVAGDRFDTVYDDRLGLSLYEEKGRTGFIGGGEAKAMVSEPVDGFVKAWQEAAEPAPPDDDRLLVSYDLYASSRFENSSRARFLLLVMSIESLIPRLERSVDELAAVDAATKAAAARLVKPEQLAKRHALVSAIGSLKQVSISRAAQEYLASAEAAGVFTIEGTAQVFSECYAIRSKIVHEGKTPETSVLSDYANKLESIAKGLLIAIFERRWV